MGDVELLDLKGHRSFLPKIGYKISAYTILPDITAVPIPQPHTTNSFTHELLPAYTPFCVMALWGENNKRPLPDAQTRSGLRERPYRKGYGRFHIKETGRLLAQSGYAVVLPQKARLIPTATQ